MKIRQTFQVCDAETATPGDLLIIPFNVNGATIILLSRDENDMSTYIVLRSDDWKEAQPFITRGELDRSCISFGKDWQIEPQLSKGSVPGNRTFAVDPGVLHVMKSSIILTMIKDRSEIKYFDLRNLKWSTSPGRDAVPITEWNIWATPTDRDDPRSEPLLSFRLAT